jgi:hypothetical protein
VEVSAIGLSTEDAVGGSWVPPDINGDIGLNDNGDRLFIQYVNTFWGVFDDTGSLVAGPFVGNSFWTGFSGFCQNNNDGDPIVLYDDEAGRWVFSQFSINQGIQCVAVSQTSDPLGPYHRYAFTVTPGGLNDYPKMGVWVDGASGGTQSAYTFTTRDFGVSGFQGSGVMQRDAMLTGANAQFVKFQNPCGSDCIEGQLPPHLAGPPPPAGTCPTFWSAYDSAYDYGPHGADGYRNHTLCVNWSNTAASTYSENLFVPAGSNFDRFLGNGFGDCIGPIDGGSAVDCLALFTMYRAQYRWFGSHASVVLNTTVDAGSDRAGIRWAEVRSADGETSWFREQDGTFAPQDGNERWMGSIAMDGDGNIALGYSTAGSSLMPSVRYVTRMASDPAGTLPGGEEICHDGTGAPRFNSGRWGDYSSMSIDPTDDCTFWYTQQYHEATGSAWNTRICSFKLAACGGSGPDCGNGVIETGEECDGPDLGGATCSDNGCTSGTVSCTTQCKLDYGSCGGCGPCNNNGTCEIGEDCGNCPSDCGALPIPAATCGNGLCEAGDGENCSTCPQDCNGKLNGKPNGRFCCGFGSPGPDGCGDSRCTMGGFSCTTESSGGGGGLTCCGDATCESPEDTTNCNLDCGGACDLFETSCTDNQDNDCDGFFDCGDSDCSGTAACQCDLGGVGDSCTDDSDCCSNKCKGKSGRKTCKAA